MHHKEHPFHPEVNVISTLLFEQQRSPESIHQRLHSEKLREKSTASSTPSPPIKKNPSAEKLKKQTINSFLDRTKQHEITKLTLQTNLINEQKILNEGELLNTPNGKNKIFKPFFKPEIHTFDLKDHSAPIPIKKREIKPEQPMINSPTTNSNSTNILKIKQKKRLIKLFTILDTKHFKYIDEHCMDNIELDAIDTLLISELIVYMDNKTQSQIKSSIDENKIMENILSNPKLNCDSLLSSSVIDILTFQSRSKQSRWQLNLQQFLEIMNVIIQQHKKNGPFVYELMKPNRKKNKLIENNSLISKYSKSDICLRSCNIPVTNHSLSPTNCTFQPTIDERSRQLANKLQSSTRSTCRSDTSPHTRLYEQNRIALQLKQQTMLAAMQAELEKIHS
jgi:hypothetical protein